MKYLTGFNSEKAAKDYSLAIGQNLGCHNDITVDWFKVIKHLTQDEWAFVVPEGEEHKLTMEEQGQLKDSEYMIENGWFSDLPP